jgi:predicted CXXCH cytochrome family protein
MRHTARQLQWAIGIAAMICIALLSRAAPPTTEQAKAENPHWKPDRCASCHDMSSGVAAPIANERIDKLCLSCHDGKQAVAEVHPIRRKFKPSEGVVLPAGFPTFNDQLGCNSCHDARFACDVQANIQSGNRLFLRNVGEGNGTELSWCALCHQEQGFSKINPHLMLNKDGSIIESKCLLCHTKVLDRKAEQRVLKPELKNTQSMICRDCHSRHQDPITQMHVGLHATPREQAFIRAKETLGLSANPSKQVIDRIQSEGGRPKLLMTETDGKIVCSTCHNVHQQGLFSASSELEYLSMQPNPQGKLVSPVRDPMWCRHCHSMW